VKFAITCAMLLVLLSMSAAAADDRSLSPVPVLTSASVSAPVSTPATAPVSDATKSLAALSAEPAPNALPLPPSAIITLKKPPATHKFFDARNLLGLASLGASLSADALSTQKGLAYPGFHEMNIIARPFVQTRAGAAVYSAGSFGLLAGAMYVAHRTHHHKLERILPFAVAGWEGLLSARNYHVIATNRR
jgi:hypothetical protein